MPGDLMRELKIRAGHELKKLKKLKEAMAELLCQEIAAAEVCGGKSSTPAKLRGTPLSTAETEAAIAWGRD